MLNRWKDSDRKKRFLLIALIVAIPSLLFAGVFAANTTTIQINNGAAVSLGAGYTSATTCDSAVDVAATQNYNSASSAFQVQEIRISKIDETPAACGNKTLTAVVVANSNTYTATWTIASASADTHTYRFGLTSSSSGTNIYSSTTLTPFALDQLSTIAIGIS